MKRCCCLWARHSRRKEPGPKELHVATLIRGSTTTEIHVDHMNTCNVEDNEILNLEWVHALDTIGVSQIDFQSDIRQRGPLPEFSIPFLENGE